MWKDLLEFALQWVVIVLMVVGAFTFYWKSRGEL
jgi:hypothetical protein